MDALFRKLGMDRHITRRDFLNGLTATVAATQISGGDSLAQMPATAASESGLTAENYPPLRTGLRGKLSCVDRRVRQP